MLTEDQCLQISHRIKDGDLRQEDFSALMADREALADMLSDCWLFIDDVARVPESVRALDPDLRELRSLAGALLRRHGAPGWKQNQEGGAR